MNVTKRDGRLVDFDGSKITSAVIRCVERTQPTYSEAIGTLVADKVLSEVEKRLSTYPSVEEIQDLVLWSLKNYAPEFFDSYRNYRNEHAKERGELRTVDAETRRLFEASAQYFKTPLQQFQFFDKYSRYDYAKGRRESWIETVTRCTDFLRELSEGKLDEEDYRAIHDGILTMKVMPSMRLLAMAGDAARRNNICLYNCSYMPVSDIRVFGEALLIAMNGCGVGFSVESQYIDQLPFVRQQSVNSKVTTFTVEDTTEGWKNALDFGIETWFRGHEVVFDLSGLRRAGTPLHTKGGRASGPEPLRLMLNFIREIILSRQGYKLTSVDAHDIMCKIGDATVAGGVRRTAEISLFDYHDLAMMEAKAFGWWTDNPQRSMANNSAVWPDRKMTKWEIDLQFDTMDKAKSGEPGIFNRRAVQINLPSRRDSSHTFGTNPCGEIVLRNFQFCNLSAAVARVDDDAFSLAEKIRLATIIGTIQSMATNFPGLREDYARNCEEERLLGVDITGQMDSPIAQNAEVQRMLRQLAVDTNREYADILGIGQSTAVTCIKPSGNTSVLLDCSSGLHARWSPFLTRRVRVQATSPIYKVLRAANAPLSPENGEEDKAEKDVNKWVVSFPTKSPIGTRTVQNYTAIDQLNYWLQVKQNYTEHNPSCTITYRPEELEDIKQWVYDNQDYIGGLSFLPVSKSTYPQLPYEPITEEEYERNLAEFPQIDWWTIAVYEASDMTEAAQTLACVAGGDC